MDIFFISKRIFMDEENEFIDGGILVTQEGQIREILRTQGDVNSYLYANESDEVFDFGDKILMPGLIDSHVHINEPGRKDWEGFTTATKAAAAGGFTTIVDMPLNSIPPTTTVENLRAKTSLARGKIFVDVAFWGGLIPDNIDELEPLVRSGVVGFKCFLCPSGVEEFPHVNRQQVEMAYEKLQGSGSVLAFHAEMEPPEPIAGDDSQPKKYSSYLNTRPPSMEVNAIQMIADLAPKYNVRTHIVHLSTAEAIPIIRECKKNGAKLTVETCHHYLSLSSEEILDSHTEFKCAPPIRDLANQELLWKAIVEQDIDLLVSDHSPCTPGPKMLNYGRNRGNFLRAWGGIASNQFGLSLFWTKCRDYGMEVKDVHRLMCKKPAQLCGLSDRKGRIAVGYDADFCVWDPDEEFTVSDDIIQFKNKVI